MFGGAFEVLVEGFVGFVGGKVGVGEGGGGGA